MEKFEKEWLDTLVSERKMVDELLDEVNDPIISKETSLVMANIISLLTLKHQILAEIYRLGKNI